MANPQVQLIEFRTALANYMHDRMILGSWRGPIVVHGRPRINESGQTFAVQRPLERAGLLELCQLRKHMLSLDMHDQRSAVASWYATLFCPRHHRTNTLSEVASGDCAVCAPKARSFIEWVRPLCPELFEFGLRVAQDGEEPLSAEAHSSQDPSMK
eukprot:gnl/Spiro4/28484_TR14076_c0_g1_i1.p1 gnl/Spiro4/28484_TR14076_c0_g1~~gnl/Spiro4/28484_TR14076_c0_g1_i1.p1  ORF type:complete len:156 (+),score=41.24 gnl/Spiro4/28484_TR14076_c0_g1_i1:76-543(+)